MDRSISHIGDPPGSLDATAEVGPLPSILEQATAAVREGFRALGKASKLGRRPLRRGVQSFERYGLCISVCAQELHLRRPSSWVVRGTTTQSFCGYVCGYFVRSVLRCCADSCTEKPAPTWVPPSGFVDTFLCLLWVLLGGRLDAGYAAAGQAPCSEVHVGERPV